MATLNTHKDPKDQYENFKRSCTYDEFCSMLEEVCKELNVRYKASDAVFHHCDKKLLMIPFWGL